MLNVAWKEKQIKVKKFNWMRCFRLELAKLMINQQIGSIGKMQLVLNNIVLLNAGNKFLSRNSSLAFYYIRNHS